VYKTQCIEMHGETVKKEGNCVRLKL